MKVSIITTAEHSALLQSVLAQINAVQDSWIFEVRENILTIFKKNEEVDAYSVREYISSNKQLFVRPVVFITHLRLEDNWFSHDFAEVSIISTHGFDDLETGFSIKSFLFYQLAQSLVSLSLHKSESELFEFCHIEQSVGCLFDLCGYKPDILKGMQTARVCDKHVALLKQFGLSDRQVVDLTKILNLVRIEPATSTNKERDNAMAKDMFSILHISDLHFGRSFRFSPKVIRNGDPPVLEPFGNLADLCDLINSDLRRVALQTELPNECRRLAGAVDLIVVSGDIADTAGAVPALPLRAGGPTDEYSQAAEFLITLLDHINQIRTTNGIKPLTRKHVICIPGNHDVNWSARPGSVERFYGFARFWNKISGNPEYFDKDPNEILLHRIIEIDGEQLIVCGFNSCTMNGEQRELREIGIVEKSQLTATKKFLDTVQEKNLRKVAIVHHHPIYIPALAAYAEDYDAILSAGLFLSFLQQNGFDLILHGHKHYPVAWMHSMRPYEARAVSGKWTDPVIVSGGSLSAAASCLPPEIPNTYQLIGLRPRHDALRPTTLVARRRLKQGNLLPDDGFENDGYWFLGRDSHVDNSNIQATTLGSLGLVERGESSKARLHDQRVDRYRSTEGWMLVHRSRKSASPEQKADISIYIVQHKQDDKQGNLPANRKIRQVLYAVGPKWPGSPFISQNAENGFELRLSAYNPFLCVALIEFNDGSVQQLERYIDFEMTDML